MTQQQKTSPSDHRSGPGWLWAVRIFLIGAIGVGSYLAWVSLTGSAAAGCGPTSNCHQVLHSRWAYWFGAPVSLGALLIYLTSLGASFWVKPDATLEVQEKAWGVLVPGAVLILGAALWFTVLQLAVIKAICPYCMSAHACGVVASVLILRIAPFQKASTERAKTKGGFLLPPGWAKKRVVGALSGLAVLVAGQVLYQKEGVSVQSVVAGSNGPVVAGSNVAGAGAAGSNVVAATVTAPVPAKRMFQLYNGLFQFDLDEVPLIGKPDAPHVFVSLFDYTCHHCRIMHGYLAEAYRAFSNDVAIVSLPMPLDSNCNPNITQTPKPHVDACEYAKLGLAVWRANRSKLAEFDEFLFTPPTPPPVADARQYAGQLVGVGNFVKAWQSPWITQQLQLDISIYTTNYLHQGTGNMPQLMVGNKLVSGTSSSAAALLKLLAQEFGLPPPN